MDTAEATRIIARALSSRSAVTDQLNVAAEILAGLGDSRRLLEIINEVRNDPAMVELCAERSLKHPLGHDKIMLIGSHPSFSLRLHVWWPDRRPVVEHVHHHRFMLATRVLRGYYEMQQFKEAESGTAVIGYYEQAATGAREWRLAAAGATHLRALSTAKITEGAGYTLSADALHRVIVPPGVLCLTLFLAIFTDTGLPEQTRVFALPQNIAPTVIKAPPLSAWDYRQQLDAIAMELTDTN